VLLGVSDLNGIQAATAPPIPQFRDGANLVVVTPGGVNPQSRSAWIYPDARTLQERKRQKIEPGAARKRAVVGLSLDPEAGAVRPQSPHVPAVRPSHFAEVVEKTVALLGEQVFEPDVGRDRWKGVDRRTTIDGIGKPTRLIGHLRLVGFLPRGPNRPGCACGVEARRI
jgi:hypothetical protein